MPAKTQGGATMYQLKAMNHRHEGLLTWLLLNPHRPLGDCARDLGYTQAWVSNVVHSDMFQALYRAECAKRNEIAVHTISSKLGRLTAAVLDRSIERIENGTATEKFLDNTRRGCLEALGYTSKREEAGPQKHLHVHVDGQTLIAARERAAQAHLGRSAQVLELPPPEEPQMALFEATSGVAGKTPLMDAESCDFEPEDALSLLGLSPPVNGAIEASL